MTKNLNRETSTQILVTFKRWDGVKDKKKLILWEFTEKPIFWNGWEDVNHLNSSGLDSFQI